MKPFKSLRAKIFVFVIVTLVASIGSFSAITFTRSYATIEMRTGGELKNIVEDRADILRGIWDFTLQQLIVVSQNDATSEVLLDHYVQNTIRTEGEKQASIDRLLQEDIRHFTATTLVEDGFYDLTMFDENGAIIAASDPERQMGRYDRPDLLRRLDSAFYEIGFDDEREETVARFSAPMRVAANGLEYRGVLVLERDIYTANLVLTDRAHLGETGETYIVRSDGLMLSPSRFIDVGPIIVKTSPVKECFENRSEVEGLVYRDYRDLQVYGSSRCLYDLGIVVLAEQDAVEVLAPLNTLQRDYIIMTVGVTSLTLVVAIFAVDRFTAPIRRVVRHMKKIEAGVYEPIEEKAVDEEYLILHNNFNQMVSVIERSTREITQNNEKLQQLNLELLKASIQLREVDMAKEQFSAMITHELKTPLVAIMGYTELLLEGSLGELGGQQKEKIMIMADAASSLLKLISNILDAHKLELGQVKFNYESVRMGELVRTSINHIMQNAKKKRIEIRDLSDKGAVVKCDRTRMLQVLDNLVDNAVKFSPEYTGKIEVSANLADKRAVFYVKDNGIGIAAEKQESLFRPFYQIDSSLSRKTGGSGLGLAISKSIVEAHGGRIWVESELGKGTTFALEIPAGEKKHE